jgi:mannose-6-phosphate isomerase-like protein (cupin superfamily)
VSLGRSIATAMDDIARIGGLDVELMVRPAGFTAAGPLLVQRPVPDGSRVDLVPLPAAGYWPVGLRPAVGAAESALYRNGLREGLCLLVRSTPRPVLPAEGLAWLQQAGPGGITLYPGRLGEGVLHATQVLRPGDRWLAAWAANRSPRAVQVHGDAVYSVPSTRLTAETRPVGLGCAAAAQAGVVADAVWTALTVAGGVDVRAGHTHLSGMLAAGEVERLDVPVAGWSLRPAGLDPRGRVESSLELRGPGWPGLASLLLARLAGCPVVVDRVVVPSLPPTRYRYSWCSVYLAISGMAQWHVGASERVVTRPGDVLVTGPDTAHAAQALVRPAVCIAVAVLVDEPFTVAGQQRGSGAGAGVGCR